MSVVGIDIGGANLKFSDCRRSFSFPFALWKSPERLAEELSVRSQVYAPFEEVAITMTGELADCFRTRREGVLSIVGSAQRAFPNHSLRFWQTGGEFLNAEEAVEFPELVAAANWHALATWAGRCCPNGNAILLDIGSTTTDIIPIVDGLPLARGLNDLERLESGELVYAGLRRTPLFALLREVELLGSRYPLAAELFATTLDAALMTDLIGEDHQSLETANGKPATKAEARHRLARTICSDCDQLTDREITAIAEQSLVALVDRIAHSIERILSHLEGLDAIVTSGEGEVLFTRLIERIKPLRHVPSSLSLSTLLRHEHSSAACAYAVSVLANERRRQ